MERHNRRTGFDIRPPRGRGAIGKTITVLTASFLTAGLTAEMPVQAVTSKQASKVQMHAHDKRATKASKRVRVRHRQHRQHGRLGRVHRTKLRAAGMVARGGWSHRHYNCLDRLWTRESGWNHRARNRYSGAYGIPQALPGGKMRSAGRDWRTNPRTQIRWSMLPDFGFNPNTQFGCLVDLWDHESHWNVHAGSPNGPYGIPQANPGTKMASAGSDWLNSASTQIKWGLGYIKGRYGGPCDALSHFRSAGWY